MHPTCPVYERLGTHFPQEKPPSDWLARFCHFGCGKVFYDEVNNSYFEFLKIQSAKDNNSHISDTLKEQIFNFRHFRLLVLLK